MAKFPSTSSLEGGLLKTTALEVSGALILTNILINYPGLAACLFLWVLTLYNTDILTSYDLYHKEQTEAEKS